MLLSRSDAAASPGTARDLKILPVQRSQWHIMLRARSNPSQYCISCTSAPFGLLTGVHIIRLLQAWRRRQGHTQAAGCRGGQWGGAPRRGKAPCPVEGGHLLPRHRRLRGGGAQAPPCRSLPPRLSWAGCAHGMRPPRSRAESPGGLHVRLVLHLEDC